MFSCDGHKIIKCLVYRATDVKGTALSAKTWGCCGVGSTLMGATIPNSNFPRAGALPSARELRNTKESQQRPKCGGRNGDVDSSVDTKDWLRISDDAPPKSITGIKMPWVTHKRASSSGSIFLQS